MLSTLIVRGYVRSVYPFFIKWSIDQCNVLLEQINEKKNMTHQLGNNIDIASHKFKLIFQFLFSSIKIERSIPYSSPLYYHF